MKMKRIRTLVLLFMGYVGYSQSAPQLDSLRKEVETAQPALLRYEPGIPDEISGRREELRTLRFRLDTLDIPESRRYRMMRDLYRGKDSRLLQKYLYAGINVGDEDPDL